MKDDQVRTTARIPKQLHARLRRLALQTGRTSDDIISEALSIYIGRQEAPALETSVSWADPLLAQRCLECAPTPVAVKDMDARIVWCNLAYESLVGMTLNQARGRKATELMADQAHRIDANIKALKASEEKRPAMESWEPVELLGMPTILKTLRFVFSRASGTAPIIGELIFDWSQIRHGNSGPLPDDLEKRLSGRLHDPELSSIFRSYLMACPAAVAIKNPATEMVWCNRAYTDLFGKDLAAMEGRTTRVIFNLQQEDPIVQSESQVLRGNQWAFSIDTVSGRNPRTNLRFPIPNADGRPAFLGVVSEEFRPAGSFPARKKAKSGF